MCEIAVVPGAPAAQNAESYVDLAATMYRQNSHGLGFVAVYDSDALDDDGFNYAYYKTNNADGRWSEIYDWIEDHADAWRIVIHARLATAGGKTLESTHPLVMEDEDIDAEYVVHNGVVNGHRRERRELKDDGHEFATEVDSEVIAHKHPDIPESLDDDFEGTQLRGRLNYLLFTDEGILVRNSGKYVLSHDFRMSCRPEDAQTSAEEQIPVDDDSVDGLGNCFALFKPDRSVETTEASRKSYTTTSSSRYTSYGGLGRGYGDYFGGRGAENRDEDEPQQCEIDDRDGITTFEDKEGITQYRTEATVEFARTSFQDEIDRHAVTDDDLFSVMSFDSVIKDGYFTVTVKDQYNDAVKNARVFVRCPATNSEYEHRGVYRTDETGAIMLPEPESVILVTAKLLTVPVENVPDGVTAEKNDDDDDDGSLVFNAQQVEWWFHYDGDSPAEADGWCSLCMREFDGGSCDDCIEKIDDDDMFAKSTGEVQEYLWGDDELEEREDTIVNPEYY